MIELLNSRFVTYYFNRSGMGRGGNAEASAFTKDKPGNPYAYLAAYTPDGTYISETEVYADKYDVLAWLTKLLADHPVHATATPAEEAVATKGKSKTATAAARLAWIRQLERLGERKAAHEALALPAGTALTPALAAERQRLRMRLLRSAQQWDALAKVLEQPVAAPATKEALAVDRLIESAHLGLARKQHDDVLARLRKEVRTHDDHPRAAELHFALGRAAWFAGEQDWARFHWMWIWHERRDDRLAMRGKIAAAALIMPYANPELAGYEARGRVGTHDIEQEHRGSCALYKRLRPYYDRGDWAGPAQAAKQAASRASPRDLVRSLRDGNRFVAANNKVVDQLVALGKPAIEPLVEAIEDPDFAGRGYAAWALAKVLGPLDPRPAEAVALLRETAASSEGYVKALSESGLRTLTR